jgi:hypothetical protein
MGMAAADIEGRLAASVGELDAVAPDFTAALDVPNGGLLCALPALLAVGLLEGVERHLQLPKGYYGLDSLLLLLAFMALARLESIEALRYEAPGEWGKLLGLDRVPEVRTLRTKIQLLAQDDRPAQWNAALCERWMAAAPQQAGVLYIDGHVRVYHGHQSQLPRHYVARQRLCLRATTDYWVNAMDGQPFFVVNQAVDPGLIAVIEQEIVPRLEQRLPGQLRCEPPPDDPLQHRFTIVFDREGYSPDFFQRMKGKRIACLTYHKFPGADWSEEEFAPAQVRLATGEVVTMDLAERGTCLSNGLWVRELAEAHRARPPNRHPVHRLSLRGGSLGCGHVRPLVPGKLLQVCPRALWPGPPGRLSHGRDFRPPTGGQPRLSPPRWTSPFRHRQAHPPPGQLRRHDPRGAHRAAACRAVRAAQGGAARGDRNPAKRARRAQGQAQGDPSPHQRR